MCWKEQVNNKLMLESETNDKFNIFKKEINNA